MMTKHVGCYIQNDFFFKTNTPVKTEVDVESALICATKCKNAKECDEGWSFQQATGKCLFIGQDENLKIDVLQPNSHIQETDRTVGWATGLKACYETVDRAGVWTDWTNKTEGECSSGTR